MFSGEARRDIQVVGDIQLEELMNRLKKLCQGRANSDTDTFEIKGKYFQLGIDQHFMY